MVRSPAVAGAFYPADKKELERMLEKFLSQVKVEKITCNGIVSPHAGYIYCGKTAAKVYKSVKTEFDIAVILGVDHYGFGSISTSTENWQTPLGIVETDKEFIDELPKNFIRTDNSVHVREHSIEVQIPWLQYLFKDFKIVPISINPIYFDLETVKEMGRVISRAIKKTGKEVLVIASSDFTHYGSIYGYKKFKGGIDEVLKKIKGEDMKIIKSICELDTEKIIELGKYRTVCGYGCIAAVVETVKLLGAKGGKLIDYLTSYEVSKDPEAIVSYCGIDLY